MYNTLEHIMRESILMSIAGIFLLCLFSCKKEPIQIVEETKVNFENPKVGNFSHYVLLQGENIRDRENHQFEYMKDTLRIEILDIDENGYLIEEKLTEGSASLNGENNVSFPSQTISYYLNISEKVISIQNLHPRIKSRLFFMADETEGLQTEKYEELEVEMESWKTSLPFQTNFQLAFLEDFELFGKMYPHLNVVINNDPMKEQLSGYTHIYSLEDGLVRSSSYSALTDKGFGWDLLSE